MKHVMQLRDAKQQAVREHAFFEWLANDRVPAQDRLAIGPAGALFIMQFRDMNRWVLRFPEPHDEFEWVINLGTLEDEKHSKMFLEDWRKLDLDAQLGWRTGDMLWWLFLSADQEPFRRSGIEFIRLVVDDGDDALIRFGHSEAGEATGHVLLSHTARVAAVLSRRTGLEYRYFGPYHLDLETGHVGNTEGVFETVVLDPARRELASEACQRMFGIFDNIFDGFLHYATTYLDAGTVPQRPSLPLLARADWTAPALVINPRDEHDTELLRHIEQHKDRLRAHPFYEWLRSDQQGAAEKLRQFIPMWVMDILGYRDLTKYALTFAQPASAEERAVNAWASRLSRHSQLFLSDWDALGLDQLLNHTASQALEWLFFDADMDLHRQNMMEFAKIALRHKDPVLRWWMLVALESTGEEFFAQTQPLALAAEAETGGRLDYLAGRHDPPDDGGSTTGSIEMAAPASMTGTQLELAKSITDHVFDSMQRQLWRSYAIVRAGKYADLALRG
ncbi:hypothetical protein [Mycobacterium vicinigordonae]|uniref:Uncharacterized protein n=1 Tax=Mycobacterium vicinigordonae TaxID=1719132 RepID=A0A7D6HYW8_9MYCO|nr:hypothetical protein [Mycobacterium vicinigordonae]QLL06054.1 hypothetical protein H0P51_20045 [Mycobacterium vicinigordonae]